MNRQEAETLAKELKELSCKGCTEGWLNKHCGLTNPIDDIKDCGELGLITTELQKRLINEVNEIKH